MPESTPNASTSAADPTAICLRVLLFSVLRDRVGTDSLALTLDPPVTGTDLLDRLAEEHPAVDAYRSVIRLAVNQSYVSLDTALHDGDEVALITPVSGG